MDDEAQPQGPKIDLVEGIFVGLGILALTPLDGIPWIGPLFKFGATQSYLAMKGMSGTYQLIMLGGNTITEFISTIPGLGLIPIDFAIFIIIFLIDHLAPSELEEKLEKTAGAVAVAAATGGAGAVAEGAAAAGEAAGAGAAVTEVGGAAGGIGATAKGTEEVGVEGIEEKAAEKGGIRRPSAETEEEESEGEEAGKEGEEEAREEEIEKQMRIGAEITPEEEAEEAVFNPKEVQFREAKPASETRGQEENQEEDDEELPRAA